MRFAAYVRTSTDDLQSPEDSRLWQVDKATRLVEPRGGLIVAVYHDVGYSRSLPWSRRPEASRLLRDLARSPDDRGWDAVVVGEPQRAFDGNQFGNTFPTFVHYEVELWLPEMGGPIRPDDEAQEMLMTMFGGLSKAERARLRVRVRGAMRALVASGTGRFLGGRPPYGYRIIRTGRPHPNPKKAVYGIELTGLDPDPVTAPVIRLIYELRLAGLGYRAIADRLDREGHPPPSVHDPARNSHRHGSSWAVSAVRSIILNPRYKGTDRFGAFKKVDRLLDPTDAAAGYDVRMKRMPEENWSLAEGVIPPLVTPEVWAAAQPDRMAPTRGPRPDRDGDNRYALRGLMSCAACGRRMQGNVVRRRSGVQRVHYRCTYKNEYPGSDHATGLAVAEPRILPALDEWLGDLFAPDRLDETVATILAAAEEAPVPDELRQAKRRADAARTRLNRYVRALDAGMDPALVARQTREAQVELAAAEATIASYQGQHRKMDETELRALLTDGEALPRLLEVATPEERRQIYSAAGVHLDYIRHEDGSEVIRASLRVEFLRVGEGT